MFAKITMRIVFKSLVWVHDLYIVLWFKFVFGCKIRFHFHFYEIYYVNHNLHCSQFFLLLHVFSFKKKIKVELITQNKFKPEHELCT